MGELVRLLTPPPDLITFTSSSTASNFVKLLRAHSVTQAIQGALCASIGPVTSATLRKLGLKVAVEATESTVPGLVNAIRNYFAGASR